MKHISDTYDRISYQPITMDKTQGLLEMKKVIQKDFKQLPIVVDQFEEQLTELFLLKNPKYRFESDYKNDLKIFLEEYNNNDDMFNCGEWFYFTWSNLLVHYLSEDDHQYLRTGRNRNLITEDEQYNYYNSKVGILGMSVGSHVALTIVMNGGAKYIKIADPGKISGSNLNRIRLGLFNIGISKTIAVTRQIYEINPYSDVELYQDGLKEDNIESFLIGNNNLDLLIEEMDEPYYKLLVREHAKKYKIPVIMAADNVDGIITDIERFDLEKDYPLLHGILGSINSSDFKNISPRDLPRYIAKMAGAEYSTVRMLKSVMDVGKNLYSWPQLGNAATLCGSVLTYVARSILLNKTMSSGRYNCSVSDWFGEMKTEEREERKHILSKMNL